MLSRSTFDNDYSPESCLVWRDRLCTPGVRDFLSLSSADPLRLCQLGWGQSVDGLSGSLQRRLLDWDHVRALAGPLNDKGYCPDARWTLGPVSDPECFGPREISVLCWCRLYLCPARALNWILLNIYRDTWKQRSTENECPYTAWQSLIGSSEGNGRKCPNPDATSTTTMFLFENTSTYQPHCYKALEVLGNAAGSVLFHNILSFRSLRWFALCVERNMDNELQALLTLLSLQTAVKFCISQWYNLLNV